MTELSPVPYGQGSEITAAMQRSYSSQARFEDVVASVKHAIIDANLWLLHEIDPQALLKKGGYAIAPTRQLLFFHPDYMARLLSSVPAAILEAPLKFAIMDLGNEVTLRWLDPTLAFCRYGDVQLSGLGKELAAKCEAIAANALHRVAETNRPPNLGEVP